MEAPVPPWEGPVGMDRPEAAQHTGVGASSERPALLRHPVHLSHLLVPSARRRC